MAQPPDFHLKLLIGDLAAQLAILRADLERTTEDLAAARAALEAAGLSLPDSRIRPFVAS